MSTLTYLKNVVRDPNIASITPTSSFGIKRILSKIDFTAAKTIVEYGPATGVITSALLKNLSADGKIVAIDTNESFLAILRKNISDPRLFSLNDSAANVRTILSSLGIAQVDYVISGIPFTFLPPDVADKIVSDTYNVLSPRGKFIVYQFWKSENPSARGIHRYLPKHFKNNEKEIELFNIPPLRIYQGIKEAIWCNHK